MFQSTSAFHRFASPQSGAKAANMIYAASSGSDNDIISKESKRIFLSKVIGAFFSASALLGPSSAAFADQFGGQGAASGTRVNSDPESLLRYGLPITNKEVREIQTSVEQTKANLRTRRQNFAKGDLQKTAELLNKNGEKVISSMPTNHKVEGVKTLTELKAAIAPCIEAIEEAEKAGQGSIQQLSALEKAKENQGVLSAKLSTFEELLVPDEFRRKIPDEYKKLPALQGRAMVNMVLKRADGSQYDIEGKLYDSVDIDMVIDGYNAPITGGNFVDLVNKGYYNGRKIDRSDGFVVQTGDSATCGTECKEGEIHGYVENGVERKIPLEISLRGDKELIYSSTNEEEGRGNAAAVLQFQAYGAMGMAREEFDNDSASTQFFWLLFESDLTPAGKNLLDGRYNCFGYTVKNADLLKGVREGDIIKSAKVVYGNDNLNKQ